MLLKILTKNFCYHTNLNRHARMALEVLKDISLNIEDLTTEVQDIERKIPELTAFRAYADQKIAQNKINPRNFVLKMDEVEEKAAQLIAAFKKTYAITQTELAKAEEQVKSMGPQYKAAVEAAKTMAEKVGLLRQFAKGPEIPRQAMEFLEHLVKVIEDGRTSVFSCKRPVSDLGVGFDQLAGLKKEKEQIRTGYIYPTKFKSLFKGTSRGILLFGPPGTGKTMLAKAATSELSRAAFFTATPGELKSKFVGETGKNIRKLFVCAGEIVERKPNLYDMAVLFMDEFDGIAADREGDDPYAGDSVNEFLQNMDGLQSNTKVSVLAATNYPWKLDDAIKRRFDTLIFVDLPDRMARISLILTGLVDAYSLPSVVPKRRQVFITDETKNLWSPAVYTMFDNLRKFGPLELRVVKEKQKVKVQRTFRGEVEEEKDVEVEREFPMLSIEDVEELAEITGPKRESKELMEREDDAEYSEKAASKYGYSASDVSKVMKKAVTLAALRVMTDKKTKAFYEHTIKYPVGDWPNGPTEKTFWFYDSERVQESGPNEGQRKGTHSIEDLEAMDAEFRKANKPTDQELSTRSMEGVVKAKLANLRAFESNVERIICFDIRPEDLKKAQKLYASTIRIDKYEEMRKWVKENPSA